MNACYWKEVTNEFETVWETSCGETFVLIDGNPEDNRLRFCAYCGGKLTMRAADGLEREPEKESSEC